MIINTKYLEAVSVESKDQEMLGDVVSSEIVVYLYTNNNTLCVPMSHQLSFVGTDGKYWGEEIDRRVQSLLNN